MGWEPCWKAFEVPQMKWWKHCGPGILAAVKKAWGCRAQIDMKKDFCCRSESPM